MATGDSVNEIVDPLVHTVDSTAAALIASPGFFVEIGVGLAFLVITIAVHGWCLGTISGRFSSRFHRFTPETPTWRISFLVSITITYLAVTHLVETLIWAVPIWQFGVIPNFRDAYFVVLEAYTTLGAGNISLPEPWRLGGPLIAISGLFTFSWTGSVLVYVMTETSRRKALREQSPPPKQP